MIDFHTHQIDEAVINVIVSDLPGFSIPRPTDYFCLGIHPWSNSTDQLNLLDSLLTKYHEHPQFFALGECGLDKVKSPHSLDDQTILFSKQIELAKKHNINRLVLHNVKTYSECLKILMDQKFSGKVLLHDFYKGFEVFEQYNKHFDTYIGLGKRGLKNLDLKVFPLEKMMFETDDSETPISELYQAAGLLLELKGEALEQHMQSNLNAFLK